MSCGDDCVRLIDWEDDDELGDAGLPGYVLATAYDHTGVAQSFWVFQIGLGDDPDNYGDDRPAHDIGGPLPAELQARIDALPSRPST